MGKLLFVCDLSIWGNRYFGDFDYKGASVRMWGEGGSWLATEQQCVVYASRFTKMAIVWYTVVFVLFSTSSRSKKFYSCSIGVSFNLGQVAGMEKL